MGLLDILNTIQGSSAGRPQQGQRQGMSPMAMAMLALLAYKALTRQGGITGNAGQPQSRGGQGAAPGGDAAGGGLGDLLGRALGGGQAQAGRPGSGGLDDLLRGGLGGLLGGAAAGGVLSGGLNDLLKQFENSGQGDVAKSWVGTGKNEEIAPGDLANALGADQINALSAQSGLSRDDLLAGLSQQLPQLIDQLTPDGRLPTEQEASRWI